MQSNRTVRGNYSKTHANGEEARRVREKRERSVEKGRGGRGRGEGHTGTGIGIGIGIGIGDTIRIERGKRVKRN